MSDYKPRVGDCVRLKSGGPKMTVFKIHNGIVECRWFDKNDMLGTNTFNIDTLDILEGQGALAA